MTTASLRALFIFTLCLMLQAARAQQCQFRIDMHDGFGDGWNDGILTVTSGATVHMFYLADDAADSTVFFNVTTGEAVKLSWAPPPFYNDEVTFSLFNNDNTLLFTATEPATGTLYNKPATCISCLKPENVLIENVYDTRAKIRWTPAFGAGAPSGWWVIYGAAGFDPASGSGDSLYVLTPKATITGLTPKTGYDFYVRQDCGSGDLGVLVGPYFFETYRSNDVGITGVTTPMSGCALGVETLTVRMTNFGANPLTLVPFNYSVNGIPSGVSQPQDGFFTDVLGKDSSTNIAFEKTFDFSAPGEYLIKVWTDMKNDDYTPNDTFYYRIVNYQITPYRQGFETWSGGWQADPAGLKSTWAYGTPSAPVIKNAAEGLKAWVTNLGGAYQSGERSYLDSPCFDFSDLINDPVIECSVNYFTELEYDGGYLEMSLDDGASWQKVGAIGEGINWYNFDNVKTGLGHVWQGNSNGWSFVRHRLNGAAGNTSARLRFAFGADDFLQYEGLGVDDVHIYELNESDLSGRAVKSVGTDTECGLAADIVSFQFANFGTEPQQGFEVAYSINGATPVVESIDTVTIAPDQQYTYTFQTPFDSRDGLYEIRCWTNLGAEMNPSNDTAVLLVNHLPQAIPFQEGFELGLPAKWLSNGSVTSAHNNSSQVLAFNMSGGAQVYKTTLPTVGFIHPGDSMTFDYRITNFSGNGTVATTLIGGTRFEVKISTDCGSTYQTVYTLDKDNHVPSTALQTIGIGLSAYAGQAIKIQITGNWAGGNFYFDIDNINLRSCPVSMNLSATVKPPAAGQSNGSATVKVGIGNPPYQFLWNTGDSTKTVNNLPAGSYTVTVIDAFGCSGVLNFSLQTVGVSDIEGLTQLQLRPNPSAGPTLLDARFEQPVDVRMQVLDLVGQVIREDRFEGVTTLLEPIDLSAYPDGLYLLRLSAGGQSATRKLVKQQ